MSITIKKIEVEKLHGLFDRKVNFKEGINLLVGINGSKPRAMEYMPVFYWDGIDNIGMMTCNDKLALF